MLQMRKNMQLNWTFRALAFKKIGFMSSVEII